MDQRRKDARKESNTIDIGALVPVDHLLHIIKKSWITSGCMSGWILTTVIPMEDLVQIQLWFKVVLIQHQVNLNSVDFSIMKFDHVEFNSGTIEMCGFESCMFDHVIFRNIKFKDVQFDLIREGTVDFQNCTFEKTVIGHYLCSDHADPLKLDREISIRL